MPKPFVLKTDYPYFNDCDEISIVRYFSADKVVQLLKNPGIWFSRFDCMGDDPDEGRCHQSYLSSIHTITTKDYEKIQDMHRLESMPLISCWSCNTDINAGLFDKFGEGDNAICCISSPGALRDSLSLSDIPYGRVNYFDDERLEKRDGALIRCKGYFYDPNDMETPVYPSLELVKRDYYSEEDELRFICFADGSEMMEEEIGGLLIPFRDVNEHNPFSSIIVKRSIDHAVLADLQDLFRCKTVCIDEVAKAKA